MKRLYYKYIIISFSLILIGFSGYTIYGATFEGWNLDPNFSFIIDNKEKMFYALGEDLSQIQMQNDRLVLTHETGAWGLQYSGGRSNITDFADAGNEFITTFNNNASIGILSNNTVYWPFDLDSPKYVNITTGSEIKILAVNFKENIAAFNAAIPPAVFIDATNNEIIVMSNHTTIETEIEISFQEAPEGLPNDFGVILLLLFILSGFILIIYLVVKKK